MSLNADRPQAGGSNIGGRAPVLAQDELLTGDGDIVVPGSVANLGGGFDTLGVAVQIYLRARIVEIQDDGGARLLVKRSTPPVSGVNALERAFAEAVRRTSRPAPTVVVEVESDIPMAAGLGSSAAATVAGLRVFERVTGALSDAVLLGCATACEGHADNAAPALLGGLTSVVECEGHDPFAVRWAWPEELQVVVGTPAVGLATSKARAALENMLPRQDAIFNLQRVLALVHALEHRNFAMVREAVQDRWHQPARAALVPLLEQALAIRDPDVIGACLAGAGPSIAVLAHQNVGRVEQLLKGMYDRAGVAATVRTLRVHQPSEALAGAAASVQGRTV